MKHVFQKLLIVSFLTILVSCLGSNDQTLSKPVNFVAQRNANSIDLSWDATNGANSYAIERKEAFGTFAALTTVTSTRYSDTTVNTTTSYAYRVQANNASGSSAWVETAAVNVLPTYQPNPLTVQTQFDTNAKVSAAIGPDGGSLSLVAANGTQYNLAIAPNVLYVPTKFTLTPLTSLSGGSFASGIVGGVRLEPENTVFSNGASLNVIPVVVQGASLARVGFKFYGQGTSFHLRPLEQKLAGSTATEANLLIWNGGTYGIVDLSAQDAASQVKQYPTDILDTLEQLVAVQPAEEIKSMMARPMRLLDEDVIFLSKAPYDGTLYINSDLSIRDRLKNSTSTRSEIAGAEARFKQWIKALSRNKWSKGLVINHPEIKPLVAEGWTLLANAYANSVQRSVESCLNEKKPGQGFVADYWIKRARKQIGFPKSVFDDLNAKINALAIKAEKCETFTLEFNSELNFTRDTFPWKIVVKANGKIDLFTQSTIPLTPVIFNIFELKCLSIVTTHTKGSNGNYELLNFYISDQIDIDENRVNNITTFELNYDPGTTLQSFAPKDICNQPPIPLPVFPPSPVGYAMYFILHEKERKLPQGFIVTKWDNEVGFGDDFALKTYDEKDTINKLDGRTTIKIKHTPVP